MSFLCFPLQAEVTHNSTVPTLTPANGLVPPHANSPLPTVPQLTGATPTFHVVQTINPTQASNPSHIVHPTPTPNPSPHTNVLPHPTVATVLPHAAVPRYYQ